MLDYGDATVRLRLWHGRRAASAAFGAPTYFGTQGSIAGQTLNGQAARLPGPRGGGDAAAGEIGLLPHVTGRHREMEEAHVFEDIMQLVDWVREGIPSIVTAEHARHVIEIIEAAYRAAETGQTQTLTTTFTPPDGA